jgi:hypothetical protein
MEVVMDKRVTRKEALLAEFLEPAPNGLIGEDDATLGQQELHIPQAQAEHMIQPDSMADDLGGKAMAVARVGRGFMPTLSPAASPTARPH